MARLPDVNLTGRTAVITGANSGVGLETARGLGRLGAHVVLGCRDEARGRRAVDDLARHVHRDRLDLRHLDLASLADVRAFAAGVKSAYEAVDILVNNAGFYTRRRVLTKDGFESTFGVNHLGHFLLTHELMGHLLRADAGRVVNLASTAHWYGRIRFDDLMGERSWNGWRAYAQAKLANVMYTYELARRLEGTGVVANAVHPGVVRSGFGRNGWGVIGLGVRVLAPFMRSPSSGARTPIKVAADPALQGVSGKFFQRGKTVRSSDASYDIAAQQRLWQVSAELTGIDKPTLQ